MENYPKHQNLYFLTPEKDQFEKAYLEVRAIEGRVYEDDVVRQLPHLPKGHPQYFEWKLRQFNTRRLLDHLSKTKPRAVLDLGCGNGWLTHQLARATKAQVLGLDVNKVELLQASRLFDNAQCRFAYGDIFQTTFPKPSFDAIVLDSCVQYFPNLPQLLDRLLDLLRTNGELHILDSPFYDQKELANARDRTTTYYQKRGSGEMAQHYFHHSWSALNPYTHQVIYQPHALLARLRRKLLGEGSPFPWIILRPKSDV